MCEKCDRDASVSARVPKSCKLTSWLLFVPAISSDFVHMIGQGRKQGSKGFVLIKFKKYHACLQLL